MATVRRRTVTAKPPVTRRRDRAVEAPEDEEEDVDVVERPARRKAPVTPKRSVVTRHTYDEEDLDDEEELDDELEDDEEEPVAPKRRPAAAKRRAPLIPVEDEDEDEEEPAPKRRSVRAPAAKGRVAAAQDIRETFARMARNDEEEEEDSAPRKRSLARRTGKGAAGKLPPGVSTGWAGAEAIAKAGGGNAPRLALTAAHELIKFLEPEPFMAFRQHWAPSGPGQSERPYPCPMPKDVCPFCDFGINGTSTFGFNILHLSDPAGPSVKILQIGIKAEKALLEACADKSTGAPRLERDFFAVNRSGKGQQSQTNFRPVKLRDLEEDWPEVLEQFDVEELPEIIEDAKKQCFDTSIIPTYTTKQLREVARYLVEEA